MNIDIKRTFLGYCIGLLLLAVSFTLTSCFSGTTYEDSTSVFGVTWSRDGSTLYSFQGSGPLDRVVLFDRSGKQLASVSINLNTYEGTLWTTNNDTTLLYQSSNEGLYSLSLTTGDVQLLSYEEISGESPDNSTFFLQSSSYPYNRPANQLSLFRYDGAGFLGLKQWLGNMPLRTTGTWVTNSEFGYFQYSTSQSLIEFLLVDTNLTPKDSFTITSTPDLNYGTAYFAASSFYFAGYWGIIRLDSATRQVIPLTTDQIKYSDLAQDGSFMVYTTIAQDMYVLNCHTGVKKKLASNIFAPLKVSPGSDRLAYTVASNSNGSVVKILPISAP